ncbi:MAG: DNA-directed RNA polymerase subunit alpha [Lachnospiraceae bacterium]|nr:DNA-directed RNA polymerase subunit alpha [Lachnospiraceae bacterium]
MITFEFNSPNIEIAELSEDKKYGRFVIEPLERGYGITVGKALKRVMQASLPGTAISSVVIDGAENGKETVAGVKEELSEILVNLKSVAIVDNTEDDGPKTAKINFDGNGEVKASDIELPEGVEITNPDLTIATMAKSGKFTATLHITKGIGYVPSETVAKSVKGSEIALDAVYTPVERVIDKVEDTRVGQVTDYDKLTLEVYTDGTSGADVAVSEAAKLLNSQLGVFVALSEVAETAAVMNNSTDSPVEKELDTTIEDLELSVRSRNCLMRVGINTIADLCKKTMKELGDIKNFGGKCLDEVVEKLRERGLELRSSED